MCVGLVMEYDVYQAIAQHYDSGTHVMMTGTKAACEKYIKEQYIIMQGYCNSHGIMDGEYVFFKDDIIITRYRVRKVAK